MILSSPIFLMALPSLLLAVGSLVLLLKNGSARGAVARNWKSTIFCGVLPGLLFLVLFSTLAVHMYRSLGGWPGSIGNHGFPASLDSHAEMATGYFGWFLLFGLFVWPVLVAVFGGVSKLRGFLPQVVALGLSFWISVPAMFLAPSDFLYWWWD